MKKLLIGSGLALLALLVIGTVTYADDLFPEGVHVFTTEEVGLICVVWPDGSGDCYCPCFTEDCDSDNPSDSAPTLTPEPTNEPETRNPCNRGIGNGSEDCDPGNSSGQGRSERRGAGEDRGESKKDK